MVNLVISQSGQVTGDYGKLIAYAGQEYSEVINIIHPSFPGSEYYIEYKYNQTIYRNKLDSNGNVSIKVDKAGYVKCQFIALDIQTGDIVFKSNAWNLIIKEELKVEPSHYPCNSIYHHYKHRPPMNMTNNCSTDFNSYEAYTKLSNELDNEEEIRFNEIQSVRQEIAKIKAHLNIDNSIPSKLDANECTIPGKYKASDSSSNFPEENKEWTLIVSTYGEDDILQHAYELNSTNVWYRNAIFVNNDITWNTWTLLNL